MARLPLLCPRCGHEQQVVPGGPDTPVRVIHTDTGCEDCPTEPTPDDHQDTGQGPRPA
jgi:hypothetical protein